MIKPPFDKFLMFDVESVGLHGEGFSFAYVAIENGLEIAAVEYSCDHRKVCGEYDDRVWVEKNVHVEENMPSLLAVVNNAWDALEFATTNGYAIVTDCGWPVETNFLELCLRMVPAERSYRGPYPLYDLSSVLAALGYDPIGTYPRKANELPAHNPLNDARQSARVLLEAMAGTLEKPE